MELHTCLWKGLQDKDLARVFLVSVLCTLGSRARLPGSEWLATLLRTSSKQSRGRTGSKVIVGVLG